MDFKFLHRRIKYVILDPVKAWDAIHSENRPIKDVRGSFFFPLIILVALAAFAGSVIFDNSGLSIEYSILAGVKYFLLYYFVIYASALILREISYAQDLGRNFTTSFKLIAYSIAPLLLCQIASRIFESFIFVNVLSFYGLYIFWIGMEKMLAPPEHKKMPMLIAITISLAGLIIAGNLILTMVVDKIYFTFFA
jgi:hypothetical protein